MVLTRSSARKAQLYLHRDGNPTSLDDTVDRALTPRRRRPQPREGGIGGPSERPSNSEPTGFLRLNLDVILSVVSQTHPMDLLSLARTCKFLRYILTDKSASYMWRAARLRVEGLPECPTDLSERQYAHLLFNDSCHGCETQVGKLYWKIRRRYCSICEVKRLRLLSSCEDPIREGGILPTESLVINSIQPHFDEHTDEWVDGDQLKALMDKLGTTSDAVQLLDDMRERYRQTLKHANEGTAWEKEMIQIRAKNFFERLQQLGYQDEIRYQGISGVKSLYKSVFTSLVPFTDAEWERMCPWWLQIMQEIRTLRQNASLIRERLQKLEVEYDEWVKCLPSGVPIFDILPHVADVAAFPPFDAIIKTPEPIKTGGSVFASAFMQLPACVLEWKHKVDAEITALYGAAYRHLVLVATDVTDGQPTHRSESLEANRHNLASILFRPSNLPHRTLCNYTELLFLPAFQSYKPPIYPSGFYWPPHFSSYPWSTLDAHGRPSLKLCQEAPHVIRACGLDPAVATVDEMEYRNARLICLMCNNVRLVRPWTNAICHAELRHRGVPYDISTPRWRLVSDEYIDVIESVECSGGLQPREACYYRCLLCRPRVGDVWSRSKALDHLAIRHKMKKAAAKLDVHYAPLRCLNMASNAVSLVEMVEDDEQVTFRVIA